MNTKQVKAIVKAIPNKAQTVFFTTLADCACISFATDATISEICIPNATVATPYKVDAKALKEALKGAVDLPAYDAATGKATCGHVALTAQPVDAENYVRSFNPACPDPLYWCATVDAQRLTACLASTMCAASDDPTQDMMHSVCVMPQGEGLACVATDRSRLHIATVSESGAKTQGVDSEAIVPIRALKEWSKVLPKSGSVQLIKTHRHIAACFESDGLRYKITSRFVDGKYPNALHLMDLMQKSNARSMVSEWGGNAERRGEIIGALKRVIAFATDACTTVNLAQGSNGELVASAKGANGETSATVLPSWVTLAGEGGKPVGARVNGEYLLDIMASAFDAPSSNGVRLQIKDAYSPIIVTSSCINACASFVGCVMPLRPEGE